MLFKKKCCSCKPAGPAILIACIWKHFPIKRLFVKVIPALNGAHPPEDFSGSLLNQSMWSGHHVQATGEWKPELAARGSGSPKYVRQMKRLMVHSLDGIRSLRSGIGYIHSFFSFLLFTFFSISLSFFRSYYLRILFSSSLQS